jgi:anti-sigma regulatory factor (Ser/Thr protein kinase)
MTLPIPVRRRIAIDADVYGVRIAVRRLACELGFSPLGQGELVIVASELASNILKYGVSGEITLEGFDANEGERGLRMRATDCGPPIADFQAALRDGWTDRAAIDPRLLLGRRGIGAGLGAVLRFSDRVVYEPTSNGKCIIAERFVRRPRRIDEKF